MQRLSETFESLADLLDFVPRRSPPRGFGFAVALMLFVALSQARTASAQFGSYPPSAQNDSATTTEEMPISIAVLSNDSGISAPLNPASVRIVSAPRNGVAAVDTSTGHVWYFPNTEFWGMDSLTYTVSDTLGNISNVATVTIGVMPDSTPPVINTLGAVQTSGNLWRVSGTVTDDDPVHVVVYFGGLLGGKSASVNADGTFFLDVSLSPGQYGMYSAQAVNAEGFPSTVVYGYIAGP